MFLVIGTDMDVMTPCCRGGYKTLDEAKDRLLDLMHEDKDDGIDNYIIQEINEGIDYTQPKTYILTTVEKNEKVEIEERLKKVEQDEAKMASMIDNVQSELERFKQDWIQKKVEMYEMKRLLNKTEL